MMLGIKRVLSSLFSRGQAQRRPKPLGHPSLEMDLSRPRSAEEIQIPASAEQLFQQANVALHDKDAVLAEAILWKALDLHPFFVDVHCNLGALYRDQNKIGLAKAHLQVALQLNADCATAAFNLAMIALDERRWKDALPLLSVAETKLQNKADIHYWSANALMGIGEHISAQREYECAFRLNPTFARARWGYAMAQLPAVLGAADSEQEVLTNFENEIARLRKWLHKNKTKHHESPVGAQQPYYLAYLNGNHKDLMAQYGALCVESMREDAGFKSKNQQKRSGHKKINIGIASAHIYEHSVWRALVKGWLTHLSQNIFDIHIFHLANNEDSETAWARGKVRTFHRGPYPWKTWVNIIHSSELDVLIYPEIGMDAITTRLAAMRLAPLQLAAWGHPLTSGLSTVDYYLSADAFEPPDGDAHYSEKLVALKGIGTCYVPDRLASAAIDLKRFGIEPEDVVLICAGTPMKYRPQDDSVLIAISKRCPAAKLVFFKNENAPLFEILENRLKKAYAEAGLSFENSVRLVPWLPRAEFFDLLKKADVYLDTVGFSGFNTAMQALQCNLPLVAYEGKAMRGRFASGLLRTIGLQAWIATNPPDYVEAVCKLVESPTLRKQYKRDIMSCKGELANKKSSVDELSDFLRLHTRSI